MNRFRQRLRTNLFHVAIAGGLLAAIATASGLARADSPPSYDLSRIVSVGGSVTEVLYLLGFGDRIVGVDTTSRFPAATETLPKLGYMRALSAEGVLSLSPSVAILSAHAGPPEVVEKLRSVGLPLVIIDEDPDVAGIGRKIRDVGAVVGKRAEAEAMAAAVEAELAMMKAALSDLPRPSVLFLLNARDGALTASGSETSADAIIDLAGARNALTGF